MKQTQLEFELGMLISLFVLITVKLPAHLTNLSGIDIIR